VNPEPRIVIARGAQDAEAYLLGALCELHEAARADPSLLAAPVRVVVPSRSLRDHVAARLVRALGGGAAGIAIQTLRALAFELLERAGEGARGGQTLLPVLVRRFAAEEPALAAALGGFEDGFGVALASVNDLLDAGLEASNAESALECLAEAGPRAGAVAGARALALVRVAERVARELAAHGLEPRAGFFRRAREALARDPARLPTRALFFHGWADVTGVQLDLVEALARAFGARVVLDHPRDPAEPGDEGPGPAWTERLRVRLGAAAEALPPRAAAPGLAALAAPGTHAEARAVADRIRALLDAGADPESVGIVLREPAPYRHALLAQLGRLGIPFSGEVDSLGPSGRRVAALLELMELGDACPADRWLDAQTRYGRERTADLRLAFHGIGVGRLRDVAELDLSRLLGARGSYRLRVRRGIRAEPSGDARAETGAEGGEGPEAEEPARRSEPERPSSRHVSRAALEGAVDEARRLRARYEKLRGAARVGAHLSSLRQLLGALGWRPDDDTGEVYGTLAALEAELGADTPLSLEELRVVLRRALAGLGRVRLGGKGAGVALLSALEARGRTFAHLFVMGLNRDVFPRLVREDPLLSDELRRSLETVLPDVPVKQRAEHEERYLFAALCAAAPQLTLSWLATTDDGKERPASPLVEALCDRPAPIAPLVLAERPGPRPAFEHAIRAGLARDRAAAEAALALALGSEDAAALRFRAVSRLDVGAWPEELGPFFGFVGPLGARDTRARELAVTKLENMAWCAWRTFLERELGLEPPPDALAELPDATPLLVGNVVHAVLEALVRDAGGAAGVPLADALAKGPVPVAWPAPDALAALVHREALAAAQEEGVVLPGFARLLATRAEPALERIRALEWADGALAVLGAEVTGALEIARADGSTRVLRFRADRADLLDGGVALTDYKTGGPVSEAAKPATRRDHLLRQVAGGRRLQGPAYAHAGEGVIAGRYVFAKERIEPESARVVIARDDAEVRERFEEAARDLLAAYELGAFPPVLLDAKRSGKARACETCDVAEACLQGETGSRRHLAAWLERHDGAPERLPPEARAAHALLSRTLGR
jgi:RecB family exonuclease